MKIKTLTLALVAAGMVMATSAQAAIITSSYTNSHETTEISQSGVLDQFDGSLGTLNSATLTFSGESISSSVLENNAANSAFFEFESVLNFFFDASSVGVSLSNPFFQTTLASTGGFVSLGSGDMLDLGTTVDVNSGSVTVTGAALAAFIGTSTFATSCNTISGTNFNGGGGNISNDQNTTAFCSGNISYDYTAAVVPPPAVSAPASALLLGAGLLGLAGVRRNKKA